MKVLILINICLAIVHLGFSINPENVTIYTANNGMSINETTTLHQDKSMHYLWIGTQHGLNQYNGHNFKVFNVPTNISNTSNYINDISEDNSQNLWLATKAGITIFDITNECYKIIPGLPTKGNVSSVSVLSDSIIVALSDHKYLLIMHKSGCRWYSDSLKITSNFAHSLCSIDDDIYIATNKGLYRLDIKTNQLVFCHQKLGVGIKYLKFVPNDSALWVRSLKKEFYRIPYQSQTLKFKETRNFDKLIQQKPEIAKTVHDIEFLNGKYWFSSLDGLLSMDKKTEIVTSFEYSKNTNLKSLRKLLFDNKGNLWCTTWQVGLRKISNSPQPFKTFTSNKSNLTNDLRFIRGFTELSNGNILVTNERSGIFEFNPTNNTLNKYYSYEINKKKGDDLLLVHCMQKDWLNRIWLGYHVKGTGIIDGPQKKHINHLLSYWIKEKARETSNDILADYKNRKVYIGIGNNVLVYSEQQDTIFKLGNVTGQINDLFLDKDDNILVGSSNGICMYDKTYGKKLEISEESKAKFGLNSINITHIIQDVDSTVWVATFGDGIYRYNQVQQSFSKLIPPEHIQYNIVYSIVEDNNKTIWMGTNRGLIAYDRQKEKFRKYGVEDGVLDQQLNNKIVFKSANGTLYFGGVKGFTCFNPSELNINKRLPPPIIPSYTIGKQRFSLIEKDKIQKKISLENSENSFKIQFYCPDYTNSKHTVYAYRLVGFNDNWQYIEGKIPQAVFTNIAFGKYSFEIKASLINGQWSEISRIPSIIIRPPFYLTIFAFIVYGLILLAILSIAVYITKRQANFRNNLEITEIEKNNIKQITAAKLHFFTDIAHEIRTPLTLILDPLKEILSSYALENRISKRLLIIKKNAQKLQRLMDELLLFQKAKDGKLSLNLKPFNVVVLIKDVVSLFESEFLRKGILFKLNCNQTTINHVIDSEKIETVLMNLIGNAIKFSSSEGIICVGIEKETEKLVISVSDTGKGMNTKEQQHIFERFYQTEHMDSTGFGIGLALSKKIIDAHRGVISVQSYPNKGSTFKFIIPKLCPSHPKDIKSEKKDVHMLDKIELKEVKEEIQGHILIVEDDLDIQMYIASLFQQRYKVSLKSNGKEGLEFAQAKLPDIIITDYRMPKMNGVEMAYNLKKELLTSHIPIIFLSAYQDMESQIRGLEIGANDYVAKPFDKRILRYKVQNLLEIKQNLTNSLKDKSGVSLVQLEKTDKQFLEQINRLITQNMTSEKIDLIYLCNELNIGKSKLNYKLKSILDITPAEYIRKTKLKEGYRLMKEENYNVAEAAYATGYSPNYFNTSFKKEFGVCPGTINAHS